MAETADDARQATMRHITRRFGQLLVARKDAKAIERESDGAWIPHRDGPRNSDPLIPFRLQDFSRHIFEKQCLGTYLLDLESKVKFMAFDVDVVKSGTYYMILSGNKEYPQPLLDIANPYVGELELALHDPGHLAFPFVRMVLRDTVHRVAATVADQAWGFPTLCVLTGGGAHVLVPFGEPIPASDARVLAREVMEAMDFERIPDRGDNFWRESAAEPSSVEIELFPKQDSIPKDGFGNLIRLPLGWHTKAKKRTFFFDPTSGEEPWAITKIDPSTALDAAAASLGME